MITNQEKLETGSQMSNMSTGSEKITFITGTKTNDKAQKKKKKQAEERPDSPMTRAAKALEMMNGAPDASLASLAVVPAKKQIVDSDSSDSEKQDEVLALTAGDDGHPKYFKDIGEQAMYEADSLE